MEYKHWIILSLAVAVLAASCATPKTTGYLQDLEYQIPYDAPPAPELVIQPGDVLNIQVYSDNATLAEPFNAVAGEAAAKKAIAYMVDQEGDIDFPVFGLMHVAGKTPKEIRDEISTLISTQGYIKTPVVKVSLGEFQVTVIGNHNTILKVTEGSLNLIQLLARTGGISANSKVKDVMVIRTENGVRTAYSVNYKTKDLYESPVFYLHQNDVVYIKPKGVRLDSSGQMVMTFVGTGLTVASIITNILIWGNRNAK